MKAKMMRWVAGCSGVMTALAMIAFTAPAMAQEANVLGLPAIPQPKPGSAPPAASGAASAAQSSKPVPTRDPISGELGLQHSALAGVGRLIITTRATFATAGSRGTALDAARLVQRELVNACAKQCKPLKMPEPKILSSGQLEFELSFSPLHQHMNQAQFMAAIQGRPMQLTLAQTQAPVVVPPSVSVQIAPSTATAPNAPAQGSPSR